MKSRGYRFLLLAILAFFMMSCQLWSLLTYTPPCGQPVLSLAERDFAVKTIKANSSALPKIPQNTPNNAYWVDGTTSPYVFLLSPAADNLSLGDILKGGEQASIVWANCDLVSFILETPRQEVLNVPALLDQSSSGLVIAIQSDPAAAGWVIRGELVGGEIQDIRTPKPEDVLAEVSLLGTALSQDGSQLKLSVSIVNFGQNTITVNSEDVSLLAGGAAETPLSSEPALPREIAPGAAETFTFTFAHPAAPEATLRVFDVELMLEGE